MSCYSLEPPLSCQSLEKLGLELSIFDPQTVKNTISIQNGQTLKTLDLETWDLSISISDRWTCQKMQQVDRTQFEFVWKTNLHNIDQYYWTSKTHLGKTGFG